MKKIIPLLVLILIIQSCTQNQDGKVMDEIAGGQEEIMPLARKQLNSPPPPREIPLADTKEVVKKRIIKDGRLGLKVPDLENAKSRVDELVKNHDGYYANENFNNSDFESSYNLNIRIPSSNFEKFISLLEAGIGEIQYKSIDARDVTDQFIDLETRLENKQNYLKRYNELLARANNVREILDIEEKIRVLEEEIESTTGRLKYLSDLVDYSTLNLTLTEPKDFKYKPVSRDKFTEKLKQSISKGWYGFMDFLLFIIKIWPFWIIVAVVILFWNNIRKKKRKVQKH
ncbi:MAG: DUF4349 domain-containing protein [Prolixibacteraceae bacterium]|nr:DUF4349 domain-containing protein [Prolixibacteraceae bacterium]MDD4755924.1 DUF4349 domain-containing protein [Prolixibacteraceae bacterium]